MLKRNKKAPGAWSIQSASLRTRLSIAFALMTVIPMLTLGYFITAYLMPHVATREIILFVASCSVLLSLIGFRILKRALRTLLAFREYMKRVAQGDLTQKFAIQDGPEAAGIARSVDVVVERLQRDRQELETYSEELEKKVAERTVELERVNERLRHEVDLYDETDQALRDSNMQLSDALAKLKGVQQRLLQQERLNALGQMASGIAHDFNNTLMPVIGLTKFLLEHPEELDDKEELVDTLQEVYKGAEEARETVRRLREFYKPRGEVEFTEFDVNAMISEAVRLTQPRWKEQMAAQGAPIEIRSELDEVPSLSGTESDLRDAVVNLLLNAVDAMPTGGTITVRSSCNEAWMTLEVADTGIGMTDEALRRCLEPFFTTKGPAGTGLGLAAVYGAVHRHGGEIDIRSQLGKGTTVFLRLPVEPLGSDETERTLAQPPVSLPPMKILVIDDELWPRILLERYLGADKHVVETASTGQEGLEKFREGDFDLVITDRAMPDMSGDQVARQVKEHSPDTPLVMLTGFGDIMAFKRECPDGVDSVVGKPITEDELKQAMAEAIGKGGGDLRF